MTIIKGGIIWLMVKIPRWLLFSLILFLLLLLSLNLYLIYQNIERSRVVKVVDGDSLDLADGRRIRLLGIDAPEKGNCQYSQGKQLLFENALGKHVRLKNTVSDAYGRILANVIVEDFPTWIAYLRWRFLADKWVNPYPQPDPYLNRLLVSAGLAWETGTNKPPYAQVLKKAESYAKENKSGIWSDSCIQFEPVNDECDIKGNIRHEVKNYYSPACRYWQQVIVNTAYGDRWFCSEEEATKAGFRMAVSCW